jgi:hypothetical protein
MRKERQMLNRSLRGVILASAAAVAISSVFIARDARANEYYAPESVGFLPPSPPLSMVTRPRRTPEARARSVESWRRPVEKVACVSLACPGYVLLGVGF